jgi:hypothetical protein
MKMSYVRRCEWIDDFEINKPNDKKPSIIVTLGE